MHVVRSELNCAPSNIHGVGTFLLEPVKKGQVLWRFDPRIDRTYTEEDLKTMGPVFNTLIDDYGRWDENASSGCYAAMKCGIPTTPTI